MPIIQTLPVPSQSLLQQCYRECYSVGTIINRNGRWRAEVRRKGHPKRCETFATQALAQAWVRRIEGEIEAGGVQPLLGSTTIGDVIDAYRKLREKGRPINDTSTEHYTLKTLKAGLGDKRLATITPDDLVDYANMRKEDGAGPYTINMDVSRLGTVLRYGGAALKIAPPDVVGAARPLLTHLRLIGGGGKRERRPTEDEFRRILVRLTEHRGLVYAEATAFAAITAMRQGEVCAVVHGDLNEETRCVPLWRKHPRKGKVLEQVPILGEAWEIWQRQPQTAGGRLFPIQPSTLSKYFTETCRHLAIPDLHFHDLRHEGTSKLFEQGYTIEQVTLVTGHKDWRNLERYTNLRPESLTQPARGSGRSARPRPDSQPSASPRPDTSSPDKSQR